MRTVAYSLIAGSMMLLPSLAATFADELTNDARRERAMEFHLRSQQPSGILLPMYVYPADIHKNAAYNRVMISSGSMKRCRYG